MSYFAPLAAGAAAFLLLHWLKQRPVGALPLDHPNHRSLHTRPVPRIGGAAVCAVSLPVVAVAWSPLVAALAAALAIVSFCDDHKGLPIHVRLVAHLAAAAIVAATWVGTWPALVAAVLATAWMINLYNFMDGSDGLAGGMATIGFGTYAIAAGLANASDLAIACATIAACAAAFLAFNFHPARMFLGDAGSIPLGFLAAAIGIAGWHDGIWPAWFPVLVFSPFVADATVTLLRRAAGGERFWTPHRTHYYQRLIRAGWSHRKTAYFEYALMLLCAGAALFAWRQPAPIQIAILIAAACLYILLALAVDRLWKRSAHEPA